jgi:hypothetical protein
LSDCKCNSSAAVEDILCAIWRALKPQIVGKECPYPVLLEERFW